MLFKYRTEIDQFVSSEIYLKFIFYIFCVAQESFCIEV
jgi:hypothetical protein